jgi:hypothetical protein
MSQFGPDDPKHGRARSLIDACPLTIDQVLPRLDPNVGTCKANPTKQTSGTELYLMALQGMQLERGKPHEHRRCRCRDGAESSHHPHGYRPM